MKKKKRKIRKSFIIFIICILIVPFYLYFQPILKEKKELSKLGYSKNQIKVLQKEKVSSWIIKNKLNSPSLKKAIDRNNFYPHYLSIYKINYKEQEINEKDILLYQRLKDKGYEDDQLENLFSKLNFFELTPLLVFDYQWDENNYIKDCLQHHTQNNNKKFTLSGNYRQEYKITHEIKDPKINTLVNYNYYYNKNYKPNDLVNIPRQYASPNQQLRKEAMQQAVLFVKKSIQEKMNFFITNAYSDYQSQLNLYQRMGNKVMKEGFSENQSGLKFKVAITYIKQEKQVLEWISKHAHEYGFIQRYPSGKEKITGLLNPKIYRYVGKELALKINKSQLSFDEYSELYLQNWLDKSLKPDAALLQKIK